MNRRPEASLSPNLIPFGLVLLMLAATMLCAPPTLGQDGNSDARKALRECRDVLNDPRTTPCEREAAIEALGRVRHKAVAVGLGDILVRGDVALRPHAARILGTFKGVDGSTPALLRALTHRANRDESGVRVAVVKALAELGDPSALPAVHAAIQGRDPLVARAGVQTVLRYHHETSIKVLIDTLRVVEREPWDVTLVGLPFHGCVLSIVADDTQRKRRRILLEPLRSALYDATGLQFETARDWMRWWNREGRAFRFGPIS